MDQLIGLSGDESGRTLPQRAGGGVAGCGFFMT